MNQKTSARRHHGEAKSPDKTVSNIVEYSTPQIARAKNEHHINQDQNGGYNQTFQSPLNTLSRGIKDQADISGTSHLSR